MAAHTPASRLALRPAADGESLDEMTGNGRDHL
jgi:hypothetical protein